MEWSRPRRRERLPSPRKPVHAACCRRAKWAGAGRVRRHGRVAQLARSRTDDVVERIDVASYFGMRRARLPAKFAIAALPSRMRTDGGVEQGKICRTMVMAPPPFDLTVPRTLASPRKPSNANVQCGHRFRASVA